MQFVDKEYDVARLADFRHGVFQALLKFSTVFRARQHAGQIERHHALAAQDFGNAALDDELRQPLDDGGLAHAGFADEHGVILGAPRENLHDALDLPRPANDRIQLASLRRLGQIAGKLVERGRLLFRRGGAGSSFLAAVQGTQEFFTGLVQIHAHLNHHMCRHALALSHQGQQDVLGAHVVLLEVARLAHALFKYFFGARRIDHGSHRRIVVAAPQNLDYLLADGIHRYPLEDDGSRARIAEHAQEQMLRADVSSAQLRRLTLRR